jgi:hypothetical protein
MANLQAIGLDPNFSDPQVYGPQRPSEQPQQLSVLDMLRKRMTRDMESEALQRVGEFGQGMLASGSPNFFTMLGAGAQAAQRGDVSRMDRLRQLAEAERQQRNLDIEEQRRRDEAEYRRQNLTLREREVAQQNRPQYQVIGTDAQGNAIVVDMRNPTQRQTLEGVTPTQVLRNQPRVLSQADIARISQAATTRANTDVGILPGIMPTPDQIARRDELQQRYLADALEAARQGVSGTQGGTPAASAGQPAPSGVLRYSGPQPAPTQQ